MGKFKGNFFQISNAIFDLGLRPIQFTVYCYLTRCADKNGKCYPSMQTIANACGCCKSTVQGAIKVLVAYGLVQKIESFKPTTNNKNRQTNNTYYVFPEPSPHQEIA